MDQMRPVPETVYAPQAASLAGNTRMQVAVALSGFEAIAVFVAFLAIIVVLQQLSGAFASGFAGYPDEPAHLVTSIMARDFIADANIYNLTHPVQFARDFYYHYPKVAIGHWPPLLYVFASVWFLLFGVTRVTALLFIATTAAVTATIIYFTGKRLIGIWAGVVAAILFVGSPLVQESSVRFMSEHLSTLGLLISVLCFARLAKTGGIADGLLFGTAATLAILAHPNGWALALLPPLTIALTNRWWLLRRPGLWVSTLPVLLVAVPWNLFTLAMQEDGVGGGEPFWIQGPKFAWDIYTAMGIAVIGFALIGAWMTLVRTKPRQAVAPEWAGLGALIVALLALHSVIPTGAENRYMVPVIPSVALFAVAGIDYCARRLNPGRPYAVMCSALAAFAVGAFAFQCFALPLQLRNGGYSALVRDVNSQLADVPQIWLVSSGASGEGSLVASVALEDKDRANYVVRAKTVLAGGDWLWNNTEDRFNTPAKLEALLNEIPVTVIVLDDLIPNVDKLPYQARLSKLVADEPSQWQLIGSYAETQDGVSHPDALHVYVRKPIAALRTPPKINLNRLKGLMVHSELQ